MKHINNVVLFSVIANFTMHKSIDNNLKAFTLVELIVSILISVILLGGIFYFMSDTILGISRASSQAKFLTDFYSFTTILDSGNLRIVKNHLPGVAFDVAMLTNLENTSGIIIGVVNHDTYMLSATGSFDTYNKNVLGYRAISQTEISQILLNNDIVYTYSFFGDKVFTNFYLKDLQLQMYNSGSIMDMRMTIFSNFQEKLKGKSWNDISKEDLFRYSLTF